MDLHLEDVILSIINIAILFFLLRLILWKHVIKFLNARSERVTGEMDEATSMREDAENLRSDYNEKFGRIEERGRELMSEMQEKATLQSEKIVAEAKENAKLLVREAEAKINLEKKQAVEVAQSEIAALATNMASRILQREVKPEDTTKIVDEFFDKS